MTSQLPGQPALKGGRGLLQFDSLRTLSPCLTESVMVYELKLYKKHLRCWLTLQRISPERVLEIFIFNKPSPQDPGGRETLSGLLFWFSTEPTRNC